MGSAAGVVIAAVDASSRILPACCSGVRACASVRACPGPSGVRAGDRRAFVCAVAVGAQPQPVGLAAFVGSLSSPAPPPPPFSTHFSTVKLSSPCANSFSNLPFLRSDGLCQQALCRACPITDVSALITDMPSL
eukprot:2252044-Pleurochrysis_carterae.AAC.1